MPHPTSADDPTPALSALRHGALSRWDNEGGAIAGHPPQPLPAEVPQLSNTELVQLRIRVIALENLMIAVLSQATPWQLDMAGEMAAYIAPRADATPHPLTVQAAQHMNALVRRAFQFRDTATE
jgi:hypothetical protein